MNIAKWKIDLQSSSDSNSNAENLEKTLYLKGNHISDHNDNNARLQNRMAHFTILLYTSDTLLPLNLHTKLQFYFHVECSCRANDAILHSPKTREKYIQNPILISVSCSFVSLPFYSSLFKALSTACVKVLAVSASRHVLTQALINISHTVSLLCIILSPTYVVHS